MNIGRLRGPIIGQSVCGFDLLPFVVTFKYVCVFGLKGVACDGLFNQLCDFLRGWPDIFHKDVIAIFVRSNWIFGQVNIHRSGQRIDNNQRRGREIVGANIRADTSFKVAVARQDRCGDEITFGNGVRNLFLDRARIPDAGRTTVSHKVKSDLIQIFLKFSSLKIGTDDLRARGKRCFDPRLAVKTQCGGFPGHEARTNHDIWVGCVGARRDRRDDDLAAFHRVIFACDSGFLAHRTFERVFHFL